MIKVAERAIQILPHKVRKILLINIKYVVRTIICQKKFIVSIAFNKIFIIKCRAYYRKVVN